MIIEMLFTNRKLQYKERVNVPKSISDEIDKDLVLSYIPTRDSEPIFKYHITNIFNINPVKAYNDTFYYGLLNDYAENLSSYKITYLGVEYGLDYFIRDNLLEEDFLYIKLIFDETQAKDENLYSLKIAIKEKFRDFYNDFYWLWDDQAKRFNIACYDRVFDLENQMRRFIVGSFIRLFGISWWEEKAPKELKELSHNYSKGRITKQLGGKTWKQVQSNLYNINIDDLVELMHKERAELELSNDELAQKFRKCETDEELLELKRKTKKYSLWNEYFSKIFEDSDFPELWKQFAEYRNIVAHNKLMDYQAFIEFEPLSNQIKELLYSAYKNLPTVSLDDSAQQKLANILENENQDKEPEKNSKTTFFIEGIDAWYSDEIIPVLEEFCEEYDFLLEHETKAYNDNIVFTNKIIGNKLSLVIGKYTKINEIDDDYRFGLYIFSEDFELYNFLPVNISSNGIANDKSIIEDFKSILDSSIKQLSSYTDVSISEDYPDDDSTERDSADYYYYTPEPDGEDFIFDNEDYEEITSGFIIERIDVKEA